MKPTKSIYILLSLFLMFSCEEEEELPNELSLDWILLKRGIDEGYIVESCNIYDECGDTNSDGELNILDLVTLINVILDQP